MLNTGSFYIRLVEHQSHVMDRFSNVPRPIDSQGANQYVGAGSIMDTSTESPLQASAVTGPPLRRPGPKPGQKPALTRKQELSRQSQRNHRQRKELYIRALEQDLLHFKEKFRAISISYACLEEENRKLRQTLVQQEAVTPGTAREHILTSNSNGLATHNERQDMTMICDSISRVPGPSNQQSGSLSSNAPLPPITESSKSIHENQHLHGLDYSQIGLDFVLAIEGPCLHHMQLNSGSDLYGHALMASNPVEGQPESNVTLPHPHVPTGTCSTHKTHALDEAALNSLLELCERLNLDGELTPLMAWNLIIRHPQASELTIEDFWVLTQELKTKVRCYGFGAVLEEFEVRDALDVILSSKVSMGVLV